MIQPPMVFTHKAKNPKKTQRNYLKVLFLQALASTIGNNTGMAQYLDSYGSAVQMALFSLAQYM